MGIVDYSLSGLAIDTAYFIFPESQSQFNYWTSTADANDSTSAWYVIFSNGSNGTASKSTSGLYFARCVRGTQISYGNNFVDNHDGTVTDYNTGLMWQQAEDITTRNWGASVSACKTLNLGSRQNWRLPSIRELTSVVDYLPVGPAINTTFFSYGSAETYWPSTTQTIGASTAWWVYIVTGMVSADSKTNKYWINCVTCAELPVKIAGTMSYYSSVLLGYSGALGGQTVQVQSQPFTEGDLILENHGQIELKGGYNCDYSLNKGVSTIYGNVTIGTGTTVMVDRIAIQ